MLDSPRVKISHFLKIVITMKNELVLAFRDNPPYDLGMDKSMPYHMRFILSEMATGRTLHADPDNGLWRRLYPKPGYLGDMTPVHTRSVLALCKRGLLKPVNYPHLHFKLTKAGWLVANRDV